jgi:NAD(P)-dependent dehydrogenase (short-subunit alcohol dehydrogenase family)
VHYVTRTFLPLLRRAPTKKIINMSTTLASFALQPDFTWSPTPAYKISKAAMNMLTVQYAQELGKEGFTCVCLVPGVCLCVVIYFIVFGVID